MEGGGLVTGGETGVSRGLRVDEVDLKEVSVVGSYVLSSSLRNGS